LAACLGLILEPARLARARRHAVGLSDQAGLLVTSVDPGSPARSALRVPEKKTVKNRVHLDLRPKTRPRG
jgi:S1-C subfamily serine protease